MNWLELEPPPELSDRVPHTLTAHVFPETEGNGWHMIAASRRGKMHAHKALFREDAFAMGQVNHWQIMVVADGGGSCPLARVGSQLAATTAVKTIFEQLKEEIPQSPTPDPQSLAKQALLAGVTQAYQTLVEESTKRQIRLRDLGTTFLCVVHLELVENQKSLIGVVQVGDGLLAAQLADGSIKVLAEPDVGESAGSTLFLTSLPLETWLERVQVQILDQPIQLLAAMCDGVADDFIPFDRLLPKIFEYLARLTDPPEPEQALLDLLKYEKRGSFDDRTLALLYK